MKTTEQKLEVVARLAPELYYLAAPFGTARGPDGRHLGWAFLPAEVRAFWNDKALQFLSIMEGQELSHTPDTDGYTPGPWRWQFTYGDDGSPEGFLINSDTKLVIHGGSAASATPQEIKANARLVAAAPELYEALNLAGGFLDWAADHGADLEAINAIRKMRRAALVGAAG